MTSYSSSFLVGRFDRGCTERGTVSSDRLCRQDNCRAETE
jgi:hypothetical protein